MGCNANRRRCIHWTNATFTNDKYPRSKQTPAKFAPIVLKKGCSIGANATILPNVTIGENAIVGAGAM